MTKPYAWTDKRTQRDASLIDWEMRLQVLNLRSQGFSFTEIGERLGFSKQFAHSTYKRMSGMTVEQAEIYYKARLKSLE